MDNSQSGIPPHMDIWSRNERLYRTLVGMGLVCDAIYQDAERTKIKAVQVSCDLPSDETAEQSAESGVFSPVQRSEILEGVASAYNGGDNVVNFPSIL